MEQHGFLFQSIPEKSSGNSENYNSCINTVSCSLEFIDNERQETQKTPKGNTQGTQQELKAESEANTVSFEYSEFSEYLQGDDHQAQSKEIPLFKVDVPVEVIRS